MIPRIVILPLSYVCDARCVMCNIWQIRESKRWTADELRRTLVHPSLAEHVEVVNLTGGEPTMRSDLPQIVAAVVDSLRALHTISVQTNGLSAERLHKRLGPVVELLLEEHRRGRSIHLDINLSCDGPGRVHDEVRGMPGAWDRLLESIAAARELVARLPRGDVTMNLTIVRQNARFLREAEQAAAEIGVPMTFTFPQTTDVYVANSATAEKFELDPEERRLVLDFLTELRGRLHGRSAMSRRYCDALIRLLSDEERGMGCPLAEGGLFLEPDGRSLPCWRSPELATGNIRTDGLDAVLARRSDATYLNVLKSHCRTCPSNCYVDWSRRMFARATVTTPSATSSPS